MNAELLEQAAAQMREDWDMFTNADMMFYRAVISWLEGLAARWSHDATGSEMDAAEAVARAYLMEAGQ